MSHPHFHAKCHYERGPYCSIVAVNFWSIRQIFNYYYIFIIIGPFFVAIEGYGLNVLFEKVIILVLSFKP